jgi:hypothetical protein
MGWRAVEGAWVSAGNDVMSAFSKAIGARPLPHPATVTQSDAAFLDSPLQSPIYSCELKSLKLHLQMSDEHSKNIKDIIFMVTL